MLNKRVSKKYKCGDKVFLLVGSKEYKSKVYTIKKIDEDRVYLDGYKTANRAQKLSQDNQENYKVVDISVHISNIVGATSDGKPSRVGFKKSDAKKERVLKKSGENF